MDGRRRRNGSILYVDTVQCNIVGRERCKKRDGAGVGGPAVSCFAKNFTVQSKSQVCTCVDLSWI